MAEGDEATLQAQQQQLAPLEDREREFRGLKQQSLGDPWTV